VRRLRESDHGMPARGRDRLSRGRELPGVSVLGQPLSMDRRPDRMASARAPAPGRLRHRVGTAALGLFEMANLRESPRCASPPLKPRIVLAAFALPPSVGLSSWKR